MRNDGFIMELWEGIFNLLSKISIFTLIRKFAWDRIENKYRFVECWVVFNLVFALIMSILVYKIDNKIIILFIVLYGMLRVFEIVVYQINVILFDPYRAEKKGEIYKVKSISRTLVLLAHNYIEIMFWYAVMTITFLKINNIEIVFNYGYYIKASFLCIATFNDELILANSNILSNIAFAEIFSGIILTVVSISRFIGLLPQVEEIK